MHACVGGWIDEGRISKSLGLKTEVETFTQKAGLGRGLLGGRLEYVLGQGRKFMGEVMSQEKLRVRVGRLASGVPHLFSVSRAPLSTTAPTSHSGCVGLREAGA